MFLLKCVLHLLQIMTIATGLNIFIFKRQKRSFVRCHMMQAYLVRKLHTFVYAPVILISALITIALYMTFAFNTLKYNKDNTDENFEQLLFIYYTFLGGLALMKIALSLYVIFYIYKYRLDETLRLLNSFVRSYDAFVWSIGSKALKINWTIGGILSLRLIALDALCVSQLFTADFVFFNYMAWIVLMFLWMPLILALSCLVGVLILHAFYCNAHRMAGQWQQGKNLKYRRMKRLLNFYGDLLTLRLKLEQHIGLVIVSQLITDVILLSISIHLYIYLIKAEWYLSMLGILFSLLYPSLFMLMSADICYIQQRLANELITSSYIRSTYLNKLLQLFCLDKLIIEGRSGALMDVLHLRKSFILTFVATGWMNGMFLNGILMSVSIFKIKLIPYSEKLQ